ncbi:hypothetical protein B0T13DRAFT_1599 [Neurospora crassa]|nr:hypothetical protein B0T13DRAFT_1599 [Neurospora crassa]
MSAEQDQRPKSAASSKKSEDQQRGHQLTDDGPVAAGHQDAYHQLSDDQAEAGASNGEQEQQQKADKPKKENPLKKFMASLKSLNCAGKPSGDKKSKKNGASQQGGEDDDDNNTPNARPVSQSSLDSKKVAAEKNAPQIDVSPAAEDSHHQTGEHEDHKEDGKEGEEKKEQDNEKIASPVDAHPPALTTTAISATPPTL